MLKSVVSDITQCRVSSVLNGDHKQYGKKYLFDGKEETCWNSDRGSPQWIEFSFPGPKTIQQLILQFQGGFAAKACVLETVITDTSAESDPDICSKPSDKVEFHPKDSNSTQTFQLENSLTSNKFKLTFTSSFDFYGRIIVYQMDILGS